MTIFKGKELAEAQEIIRRASFPVSRLDDVLRAAVVARVFGDIPNEVPEDDWESLQHYYRTGKIKAFR
jgi:hypothetical protein